MAASLFQFDEVTDLAKISKIPEKKVEIGEGKRIKKLHKRGY